MPGYVAPSNAPSISLPFSAPSGPGASYGTLGASQGTQVGLQESRKRSHNDRNDDGNGNGNGIDLHYVRDDRQIKQMRRGRGGRGDGFGARGGRGGFQEPGYPHAGSPPVPAGFPPMPIQSQGMPFDPNDPMAAFMAMQAMGLPALPGMPPLPQAGSPNGQIQLGGLYFPDESRRTGTVRERCKDYDTQGYCTRGDTCPYLHGTDRLVVPGEDGEVTCHCTRSRANIVQNTTRRTRYSWMSPPPHLHRMDTAQQADNRVTDTEGQDVGADGVDSLQSELVRSSLKLDPIMTDPSPPLLLSRYRKRNSTRNQYGASSQSSVLFRK